MPYNDIDIDGKKVMGHRYIGGGAYSTMYDYTFSSTNTKLSFTAECDGLYCMQWVTSTAAGNWCYIDVNGYLADRFFVHSSNVSITFHTVLPVKAGDLIEVYNTSNSGSTRGFISRYRQ